MQYLQIRNKRHISYMESLDNMEEIRWATLEFESRVNDKFKFNQGVEEWIASFTDAADVVSAASVSIYSIDDKARTFFT